MEMVKQSCPKEIWNHHPIKTCQPLKKWMTISGKTQSGPSTNLRIRESFFRHNDPNDHDGLCGIPKSGVAHRPRLGGNRPLKGGDCFLEGDGGFGDEDMS